MKLEEYVEINYPLIKEEYERFCVGFPVVGQVVKTLVSGYGGQAGVTLKVKEIDDKYITLYDNKGEYSCLKRNWHKELAIIK